MKFRSTILAAIILSAPSLASAYTCKNVVERINGEWVYTSSVCGNQAPASAATLEAITFIANNPPKDAREEEAEVIVVEPVKELTRLEKLDRRMDNLNDRLNSNRSSMVDALRDACAHCSEKDFVKMDKNMNKATKNIAKGKTADAEREFDKVEAKIGNVSNKDERKIKRVADRMVNIHKSKLEVKSKINKINKNN